MGASDHTIALFYVGSGRVLGFCILIHYILWLIMRIIVCFIYVVVMRSL